MQNIEKADWSVNAGNWNWVSCGDPEAIVRESNTFCPTRHGKLLDPDGVYIKLAFFYFSTIHINFECFNPIKSKHSFSHSNQKVREGVAPHAARVRARAVQGAAECATRSRLRGGHALPGAVLGPRAGVCGERGQAAALLQHREPQDLRELSQRQVGAQAGQQQGVPHVRLRQLSRPRVRRLLIFLFYKYTPSSLVHYVDIQNCQK